MAAIQTLGMDEHFHSPSHRIGIALMGSPEIDLQRSERLLIPGCHALIVSRVKEFREPALQNGGHSKLRHVARSSAVEKSK